MEKTTQTAPKNAKAAKKAAMRLTPAVARKIAAVPGGMFYVAQCRRLYGR